MSLPHTAQMPTEHHPNPIRTRNHRIFRTTRKRTAPKQARTVKSHSLISWKKSPMLLLKPKTASLLLSLRCVQRAQSQISRAMITHRLAMPPRPPSMTRSEEHTSELQSRGHLVCRLLLEKKNILRHVIKVIYFAPS